ncbi:MAG: radical SAM protein [Elusimicrobia bacterium]|nr:radical SAM protein [Elusimicrobiota bacterium]
MPRKSRTLALAFFPTPFSGEAAQYELGLHRLPRMIGTQWRPLWVQLAPAAPEDSARAAAEGAPAAVLLHVHRTQAADALAFANALGRLRPGLPLIMCGWPAHPPYVDAVAAATGGLTSPSFALLCGEVEAVMPRALEKLADGGGMDALAGVAGIVVWDQRRRAWRGSQEYAVVEDLDALPDAALAHIPKAWKDSKAGWLELARGCKYRCAFCLCCAFPRPRLRRFGPERIRAAARAAVARGVEVLGLLATSNSFDVELLRSVTGALRELGLGQLKVAGPVHARHARGEALELLASLNWDLMTIGLQTLTPEAQRLLRRKEDPEDFARTMESIASFATPEVEIVLGLPGDTPEGFRKTVRFVLGLPVKVTVQSLRLDPWSDFLADRGKLGLKADFARAGVIRSSPTFPAAALEDCRDWLRRLGRAPWTHRARTLALDGEHLNARPAGGPRA